MKMLAIIIVLLLCISLNNALPTNLAIDDEQQAASTEGDYQQRLLVPVDYASEASQLVAINLLKSNNDIDGNQVHSSLGITTMLAILAEASNGRTYEEFVRILHYPEKRSALKKSYKGILAKYQTRVYGLEPSFQTWLYVYRNFTIREDFRRLLRTYYYVDVKDINRDEYDWSEPNTSLELEGFNSAPTKHDNSKDVIGFETLKRVSISSTTQLSTANNVTVDGYGEEFVEKETSKLDRIVDDKQYVEKPQLFAEIKQQQQTSNSSAAMVPEIEIEKEAPELGNGKQTVSEAEMKKPVPINSAVSSIQDASTWSSISTASTDKLPEDLHLNLEENETVQESEKLSKNPIKVNAPESLLSSVSLPPSSTISTMSEHTGEEKVKPELGSFFTTVPSAVVVNDDLPSSPQAQVEDKPKKISLPLDKLVNALDEASRASSETATMMSLESHVSTARSVSTKLNSTVLISLFY